MITVRPFRGLRPPAEKASAVACPPYDVLDSDEAREQARGNALSLLHVEKPEIDLDPSIDVHDPHVYRKGSENLQHMIENGALRQDETPCFYVYRLQMGTRVQTGLMAAVSVADYEAERIKKHEHTRPDKEEDRTRHIQTLHAHTGPVFLMMRDQADIRNLMRDRMRGKPECSFVHEYGVRHTFWVVDEASAVRRFQDLFRGVEALYIADGHHRAAAACRAARNLQNVNPSHTGEEEYNFFLAVVFPASELTILNYNRIVKDLNGLSKEEFLARVRESFETEVHAAGGPYQPDERQAFGMFLGETWWSLKAKRDTFNPSDPIESLDVSILQNKLLGPVLGIGDPRTDKRIDFVGGIRGLDELQNRVKGGAFAVAFSLYPTGIDQLLAVSDARRVMPPKSTWFEPKLRSGLAVHLF